MNSMSALVPPGLRTGHHARGRALAAAHSLANMRLSQMILVIPLFLAIYATVLRSSITGAGDSLLDIPIQDTDLLSERYMVARTASHTEVTGMFGRPQRLASTALPAWKGPEPSKDGPKIAFCVTTAEPLADIRLWLQWNRAIGVQRFYLFVQGRASTPENIAALRLEPDVHVLPYDATLKKQHHDSRIWNEGWLAAFFHKPCNHELFVLQSLNMEVAIRLARDDGIDWLLHVDTDELVYPSGSPNFSLQQVLAAVPADIDQLVFPNHESLPETTDVEDPFVEVTLFKRSYMHVNQDVYFKSYAAVAHGNPNYFLTYANGKSAARVQPGMRPNGAHRFASYTKRFQEVTSDEAAVLHYTYNRFSDLKNRRDRCDCAPTEEDAKRCFMLAFDRQAFLESSLKSDAELHEFFEERLLWKDAEVVDDLLHKGLFLRIYEPQLMIRGFQAAHDAALGIRPGAGASNASAIDGTTGYPRPRLTTSDDLTGAGTPGIVPDADGDATKSANGTDVVPRGPVLSGSAPALASGADGPATDPTLPSLNGGFANLIKTDNRESRNNDTNATVAGAGSADAATS